jgi:hypothetical protein
LKRMTCLDQRFQRAILQPLALSLWKPWPFRRVPTSRAFLAREVVDVRSSEAEWTSRVALLFSDTNRAINLIT